MFHWLMKKVSDPQEPEVVMADESLVEGSKCQTSPREDQSHSEDSYQESSFKASTQRSPKEHIAESISRLEDCSQVEEIDTALEFPEDATSLAQDAPWRESQPVNDREMTVKSSKDFGVLGESCHETVMLGQSNMHNNFSAEKLNTHHSLDPSWDETDVLAITKCFQDEGAYSDGSSMNPSPHDSSGNGELHLADHLSSENFILESSSAEKDFGSQKGDFEKKSLYSHGKDVVHVNMFKESFCDRDVESVPASSSAFSHSIESEENPLDETDVRLNRTAADAECLMSKMISNPCSFNVDTLEGDSVLHNINENLNTQPYPSKVNIVSIGDVSALDSCSTPISREAANVEAQSVTDSFLPCENTAVIPKEITRNIDRESMLQVRNSKHETKFKNTGEVHKVNSPDTRMGKELFVIHACNYPYPCCTHSFCLYNQSGKLCTVLGQRYIFTEVNQAPLLVCLEDSAETPVRPCKILWRGSVPLALSQIEDGTDVMFDAVVMPSSKKVVAVIVWHTCKPSVISHLQQGSLIFIEEVTGFQVQLISFNKKKTGVIKAVINGEEENVTFSTEVVFLNCKKLSSKTDLHELFKYPSSQIYATLNKFLSGDLAEKFIFVPTCIWNGAKPNSLLLRPPLVQGKAYNGGHTGCQPRMYSNLHCDVPCLLSVTKEKFELDFALDNEVKSLECTNEELYFQNNQLTPVSSYLPFSVKVKAHILERKTRLQVKKYKVILVQVPDVAVIKVKTNDQAMNTNNEVKSSGEVLKDLQHKLDSVPEAKNEVPVLAAESKEVAEHVCNDIPMTSEIHDVIASEEKEPAEDFSAASTVANTPNLSLPECELTDRRDIIENKFDSVDNFHNIQQHEIFLENNDSLPQMQVPVQLSGSSSSVLSLNQSTPPDAPDLSQIVPEPLSSMFELGISASSTEIPLEIPDTGLDFYHDFSSKICAPDSLLGSETTTACETQLIYPSSESCSLCDHSLQTSVSPSAHDDSLQSPVRSLDADFDVVRSSSHDKAIVSNIPAPLNIPSVQDNLATSVSMSDCSSILCQSAVDESMVPVLSTAASINDNFEPVLTSVQNSSLHMKKSSSSSSISSNTSSSSSQPFFSPSVGSPLCSGSSSSSLSHTPSSVSQEDISTLNPTDNAKTRSQSGVSKLKKAPNTRKCSSLTSLSWVYNASMSRGHWSYGMRVPGPSSSSVASSPLGSARSSEAIFNTSEESQNIQPKIAGLSSDTKANILNEKPKPSISFFPFNQVLSGSTNTELVSDPVNAMKQVNSGLTNAQSNKVNTPDKPKLYMTSCKIKRVFTNSGIVEVEGDIFTSNPKAHFLQTVVFVGGELLPVRHPEYLKVPNILKAVLKHYKNFTWECLVQKCKQQTVSNVAVSIIVCLMWLGKVPTEHFNKCILKCDFVNLLPQKFSHSSHVAIPPPSAPSKKVKKPKLYLTTCKIVKLAKNAGILKANENVSASVPVADFVRRVVFVNGKSLLGNDSEALKILLEPYQNETWTCLLLKSKARMVSLVSVNFTTCLVWLGKLPTKQYNKLKLDNEVIKVASVSLSDEACSLQKVHKVSPPQKMPSVSPSQKIPSVSPSQKIPSVSPTLKKPSVSPSQKIPSVSPSQKKPSVSSVQKVPNLSTLQKTWMSQQNLLVDQSLKTIQSKGTLRKGVVTKVENTNGYLKPCEQSANGELEFTRHKGFLFNVSLKDTNLRHVLAADLQVEYEELEGKIQAVYVGGSYADTQDSATRYYLLSAWCEHYKVPLKTKETLLLEVGWLPPELCPLASSADNQIVNAK